MRWWGHQRWLGGHLLLLLLIKFFHSPHFILLFLQFTQHCIARRHLQNYFAAGFKNNSSHL